MRAPRKTGQSNLSGISMMRRIEIHRHSAAFVTCLLCAGSAVAGLDDRPGRPVTRGWAGTVGQHVPEVATTGQSALAAPGDAVATRHPSLAAAYGRLPLSFEANTGQTDAQVRFLARGPGYTLFLTGNEAVLSLPAAGRAAADRFLRMRMMGANANAVARGGEELPGSTNYLIGNDPKQWRTNVPSYARVTYAGVYPGVDLVYYGNQSGQLEYDFVVAPGADPSPIALEVAVDGVRRSSRGQREPLRIAADGDLLVKAGSGDIRVHKPLVYQYASGDESSERLVRDGRFVLLAANQVGFSFGPYDHSRALIVDPVLTYSTYLGGTSGDQGLSIAVDSAGNAYVTGAAGSTDFPTVNPLQPTHVGGGHAFVAKMNAAGSALVYSTYLGGSLNESGNGIAVDTAGNAYVTGQTTSSDFPTVNPVQPTNPFDNGAAFVAKLNAAGSALVYSTYLGGVTNGGTVARSIAVDSAGNSYVTGVTYNTDFPTVNPLQAANLAPPGAITGFVAKYNVAGSALIYSTYLGGSGVTEQELVNGIAADASGNAYVTGATHSVDFPTANALQPVCAGCPGVSDAFVTKINATGSAFVYSTFLGGSEEDTGLGIAADSSGNAYVTGITTSSDFPTMNPLQAANRGNPGNVFVTKLNAAGSALVYSTYLGGSGSDQANAIAVDAAGRAYVAGRTTSADFPTVNAVQATKLGGAGNTEAFVANLDAAGSALLYATYLGGTGGDYAFGIAVDSAGSAYVTGYTASIDFPTASPFQPNNNGGENAFVSKLPPAVAAPPASVIITAAPTSLTLGQAATLTWSSSNATACTATGGWSGSEAVSGTASVTPGAAGTSTYTLTCTGPGGSSSAFATVTAAAAVVPTVTIAPAPATLTLGQSATLTWSSTSATACTASGAWSGAEGVTGTAQVTPAVAGANSYALACTGPGGSGSASATVTVLAPAAPTMTFSASPASLTLGQSATLTWSSTNATACSASGGWSGPEATSGTASVTPASAGQASYALSCSGGGGSVTAMSVVTVSAPVVPAPPAPASFAGKAGGGGAVGPADLLALALLGALRRRRALRRVLLGVLSAAGLVLGATPAAAQDASSALEFRWDQGYAGIRLGTGSYTETSGQLNDYLAGIGDGGTTTSVDQHRTAGVIYAGVPFYQTLSLELGVADLGTYPVSVATTSATIPQLAQSIVHRLPPAGKALTLGLAASPDLGQWLTLEPRVGLMAFSSKQQVDPPTGTVSTTLRGIGIDGGLALLVRATRHVRVGAGVDCFAFGGRCNVLLYSVELEYHFGG